MIADGFVAMAVYRPDLELLAEQLRSLQAQTRRDWTCLVGIDGADEPALAAVRRLVASDERFTVVSYDENVGVYAHFERLLRHTPETADWFALADQDDRWAPDKLERLVPLVEAGACAVSGQAEVVAVDGRRLGRTRRRPGTVGQLLLRNQVTGAMTVFARETLSTALPFPPASSTAMHDHWLGVCAAAAGRVVVVDEVLQEYVQHGGNVLGEARPLGFWAWWRSAAPGAGIRGRLDAFAAGRWAWRISMARALVARRPGGDLGGAQAVAAGRITPDLVRLVVAAVVGRRLRVIAGLGALACAWRWRALEEAGRG